MANLLSENKKREIRREFFARVFVVFLTLVFFGVCLSVGLTLSSYILLDIKKEEVRHKIDVFKQSIDFQKNETSVDILKKENLKLQFVQAKEEVNFTKLVNDIVENQPSTIKINTFYYEEAKGKGQKNIKLIIRGTAEKRSDLINFVDVLEKQDDFLRVDFPVSDLTKGEGIDFSLIILIKNNDK